MKEKIEARLATLPARPGVYLMRDSEGRIIYVGKAKLLTSRVRSYFRGRIDNPRTAAMVARVADLDYIVTDSEVEALLLESNLIKEHRPRYNVSLKDDKRYPYLKVTLNEEFPRAFVTRRYERDGGRYFGPYSDAGALRTTLEALRKIFPIRTCRHDLPFKRGQRECLNYHLGRCSGPCHGHISSGDYRAMIDEMLLFLEGRTENIEKRIEQRMRQASENLDFENAARFRDQLAAVQKVSQRQKMHSPGGSDRDILAVAVDGTDACGVILKVRDGKLIGREHHYMRNQLGESQSQVLAAFITQKYFSDREYPPEVFLGEAVEDLEIIEQILSESAGRRVRLRVPERGEKAALAAMAERNSHLLLEELVLQRQKARQRVPEALLTLQKTLHLPRLPRLMVCFDISTIQGEYAVAAMSCFRNGQPSKSGYRRFRIRTVSQQDDFAMMKEAVGRYFARVASGELDNPTLVVIDGGKGQLASALEAVRESGVEMPPMIGLAKREEEIFLPGEAGPYVLSRRSEALRMLQRLRDEAHRFAVGYHRTIRTKENLISRLEKIPGIGKMRSRALISEFGSPEAVRRAGAEKIAMVNGFSAEMAARIMEHLNGTENNGEEDAKDG